MELTDRKPPDQIETTHTPLWLLVNHPDPQAVLDANRYYDVEFDNWWDYVYDHLQEQWEEIGLSVDQEHMEFSGFCSQGDGACFTDCRIDWEKFWPQLTGKYWLLARFKAYLPQPSLTKNDHHYSHEYTVSIEFVDDYRDYNYLCDEILGAQGLYPPTDENWPKRERYEKRLLAELNDLAQELTDLLRDKMREMYGELDAEYDSLTSDEYLRDRLSDESYMFEADGTIHHV